MRLTAGLDEGPLCLAAGEPILPHDTYGSLAERLQELGATLLLRALDESPPFVEQAGEATYAEKIGPDDRRLRPDRPAVELERTGRALQPHIGRRPGLDGGGVAAVRARALPAERPRGPPAPGA